MRFKLKSLLLLIVLIAILMAVLNFNRERGRDRLVHDISSMQESVDEEEPPFKTIDALKDKGFRYYHRDSEEDSREQRFEDYDEETTGMWARLFKSTHRPLLEITIPISNLTPAIAKRLQSNRKTRGIERIRFVGDGAKVDEQLVPFFEKWATVNRLQFVDASIPESWWPAFGKMKDLRQIDFVGLDPIVGQEKLKHLVNVELVQFAKTKPGFDIELIKESLPNSKVQIVAVQGRRNKRRRKKGGSTEPKPEVVCYSKHDPVAYKRMKAIVDRLHRALESSDPPSTNKFNPPATKEQIAQLETYIGMPLHPSLRAWLEIHNGQPDEKWELVSLEWLRPIDKLIEEDSKWQEIASEFYDLKDYDFDANEMCIVNPNLLSIGSSDDHVVSINLVHGNLTTHCSESDPRKYVVSFEAYLEGIAAKIEAEKYDD